MSVVMPGVKDVARAKRFYVDGLGAEIDQDFPGFVRCRLYFGYFSDPDGYLWKVATAS